MQAELLLRCLERFSTPEGVVSLLPPTRSEIRLAKRRLEALRGSAAEETEGAADADEGNGGVDDGEKPSDGLSPPRNTRKVSSGGAAQARRAGDKVGALVR